MRIGHQTEELLDGTSSLAVVDEAFKKLSKERNERLRDIICNKDICIEWLGLKYLFLGIILGDKRISLCLFLKYSKRLFFRSLTGLYWVCTLANI